MKTFGLLFLFISTALHAREACLDFFSDSANTPLAYAQHFSIKQKKDLTLLQTSDDRFVVLATANADHPKACEKEIVTTPIKRMIPTSTSSLHFFEMLNAEDSIQAYPSTRYISSAKLQKRVESGELIDLGEVPGLEWLITLAPDLILTQGEFGFSQLSVAKRYRALRDREVSFLDYKESTPLAKAEWILFLGHLLGLEEKASKLFNEVKENYEELRRKADSKKKKKVLVGSFYQGSWSIPAKESDFYNFLQDAALESVMMPSTLGINFEEVLIKMNEADYWLPQATWSRFDQALARDERHLVLLDHFELDKIFPLKKSSANALDFWEKGVARPDLVLQELMLLAEFEKSADHKLRFFHREVQK